jgi:pimeloyl-ACP methyl ester carboxylesterase
MTEPATRPPLAYHLTVGKGPPILFLPGYASDMEGTKALALAQWAKAEGRTFLRFDYAGCGASEGDFADQTLTGWRDDVLAMLDLLAEPAILVGSSMGGWIMLMIARDHPELVAAIVGIAAAADFTDWGFTMDEKMKLLNDGKLERPSDYSDQPTVYTSRFWQSGEASRMTAGQIAIDCPARFLHGMRDPDVPWIRSTHTASQLRSANVQIALVKDGDHRLSRDSDIALLIRTVEEVAQLP